ncbi:MAG TPA: hypothetical protein VK217_02415 [Acidimicrobiales bacterium]|nr:hypothetical protein [Acidimicrobiales bacterium]
MRPRSLIVTATAAIAFAAGCGSSSTGSNGIESKSGAQIVAAAVAATTHQNSFHFVETAGAGSSGVLVVGDVGSSTGEQHVTIHDGKKEGHLTLLLVDGTAYFEGDALGLEGFTGLSATLSSEFAGRWISVPSTNQGFSTIAGTLAVKTAAAQLVKLPGTLTRGRTSTQMGHATVAVKATQRSSSGSLILTIYVATTGPALPILVEGTTKATGSSARSISARFSDWDEALNVTAPSNAIPIADLQALAG